MTEPNPVTDGVPPSPEGPTMKVVTPTGETFFDSPDAAIVYAAEQRIIRNGPAFVFTLDIEGEWMAVDW